MKTGRSWRRTPSTTSTPMAPRRRSVTRSKFRRSSGLFGDSLRPTSRCHQPSPPWGTCWAPRVRWKPSFSILAMRDGIVAPPTLNLDNPSEGCDLDFVPHEAKKQSGSRGSPVQLLRILAAPTRRSSSPNPASRFGPHEPESRSNAFTLRTRRPGSWRPLACWCGVRLQHTTGRAPFSERMRPIVLPRGSSVGRISQILESPWRSRPARSLSICGARVRPRAARCARANISFLPARSMRDRDRAC